MKKFFTLIAAVAMAASVNAQGTYAVSEGEVPAAKSTITSVSNIVMTWGDDKWKDNKKVDGKFEGMDYKVTGATNCAFDETNKLVPVSGAYVMFEAEKEGVVTFCYKLNKNKAQYFVDDSNTEVVPHIDETTGSSVYLSTDFSVKPGVKYYVYTKGSKMDVFGFKYVLGTPTGISNISSVASAKSTATYNLAGQQVSDSYKGIVIQNGKKFLKK